MTKEAKTLSRTGSTGSKQMSAKQGITLFGERAVVAIYKDYKQLNNLEVVKGVNPDELEVCKEGGTEHHQYDQGKRTRKIKGRSLANGRKQRGYVTKEELSSPSTLSLEGHIITMLIDAIENRDAAIFDMPRAYTCMHLSQKIKLYKSS